MNPSAPARLHRRPTRSFPVRRSLGEGGSFLFLLIFLPFLGFTTTSLHAAPLTRDLGEGLTYHRARTLPGDLPTDGPARPQPCVLDLRYTAGDAAAATAFHAWLKFHVSPRTPVLLLINADTAPVLLAPFAERRPGGLVLIGPATAPLTPDIVVKLNTDTERNAYDALGGTTPAAALITDTLDKPRNDEARLMRDRGADPTTYPRPADDASDDFSDAPSPAPAAKPKAPPALLDVSLQRAVHLHRALKALRKL
jgi:hypothetical protein